MQLALFFFLAGEGASLSAHYPHPAGSGFIQNHHISFFVSFAYFFKIDSAKRLLSISMVNQYIPLHASFTAQYVSFTG
jgi:hypothetical protein